MYESLKLNDSLSMCLPSSRLILQVTECVEVRPVLPIKWALPAQHATMTAEQLEESRVALVSMLEDGLQISDDDDEAHDTTMLTCIVQC